MYHYYIFHLFEKLFETYTDKFQNKMGCSQSRNAKYKPQQDQDPNDPGNLGNNIILLFLPCYYNDFLKNP